MKTLTNTTLETTGTGKIDFKHLNQVIADNIEKVLDYFDVDYISYPNRVACKCPVHISDKQESLTLYTSGSTSVGNFVCWTNHCEDSIGRGGVNLVKYMLSKKENKNISFKDVVNFISSITGTSIETISLSNIEKRNFINLNKERNHSDDKIICDRAELERRLNIPASYYIDRGYLESTLRYFGVGYCNNPSQQMYNRVVVPTFDISGKYVIGCSGRSLYTKCCLCEHYHDSNVLCPDSRYEIMKCHKWINSKGFNSGNSLYNLWNAKKHIIESDSIIIVEGSGDVWKLYEAGIYNSVSVFGCKLTDGQFNILETLGITNVYLCMDKDESGQNGQVKISEKLKKYYNIFTYDFEGKDIGDLETGVIPDIINIKRRIRLT